MWTKVTCPSGHVLKVRTKHGGGSGTCPQCKLPVEIPEFDVEHIIDLLLPEGTRVPVAEVAAEHAKPPQSPEPKPIVGPKHLSQFRWEMFDKKPSPARAQAISCPHCGTVGFPGQTICNTCGQATAATR